MEEITNVKDIAINSLKSIISDFASAFPNLIGALVLLLIGWLIAKFAHKILKRVLKAIKIDAIGEKLSDIDFIKKSNMKIEVSSIIAKFFYYIILFIFLISATETLGLTIVSEQISDLIAYLPRLLSALIILIMGLLVADFIRGIVKSACDSMGIASSNLISGFIFYFLFITIALSALSQAGIDVEILNSNITLILGGIVLAFALAYGLASRNILASVLTSYYSKSKFKIGDQLKVGSSQGQVIASDSTSITLKTETGRVIIPMSELGKEKIEIFD